MKEILEHFAKLVKTGCYLVMDDWAVTKGSNLNNLILKTNWCFAVIHFYLFIGNSIQKFQKEYVAILYHGLTKFLFKGRKNGYESAFVTMTFSFILNVLTSLMILKDYIFVNRVLTQKKRKDTSIVALN